MGGSIVNDVPCIIDGDPCDVRIIASHDTVEINGFTFKRRDLLFAIGARERDVLDSDNNISDAVPYA